jgi:hypothetical protein
LVHQNGFDRDRDLSVVSDRARGAGPASRSYELSKIVTELSDVSLSIAGLNKTDPIQKVAICDNSGYCIDLRTKTGSNGIVSRVLPVDANEPPRVTVVR